MILDFATSYDLIIVNTLFQEKIYLITYKSG